MKKYYLTTPLYYVNAKPHIGHSYTTVAADCLARFKRLLGYKVLFLTGTDEHGQKIAKAAAEAGLEPAAFTDQMSATFRDLWQSLNVKYDDFIRTTEPRHKAAVKAVWLDLQKKGEIDEREFTAWYCVPDERFLTDFEAMGGAAAAGPVVCPDCKRPVERMSEKNLFFKMSKYQDWLTGYIRSHPDSILPESRRNEVLGFLDNNKLEDLCVTRPKAKLTWGIECPLNPNYVTYVWFDALINYISACGYPKTNEWWPADVHIVGKDILRHHAVFWPIILKALGLEPPRLVFAHGWWVQGGEKMSKSKGNVTDPIKIIEVYGVDAFRYFLLRETPFGEDGIFTEEALLLRYNTDLANDLGNLLSRALSMFDKYFTGYDVSYLYRGIKLDDVFRDPLIVFQDPLSHPFISLRQKINALPSSLSPLMERLAFSEALQLIWALISEANQFVEKTAPWKLEKQGRGQELQLVIGALLETLKIVSQAIWPFMPATAENMWTQLGLEGTPQSAPFADDSFGFFQKGKKIAKGGSLFPRKEKEKEKA